MKHDAQQELVGQRRSMKGGDAIVSDCIVARYSHQILSCAVNERTEVNQI